jgi:hypothetical protein
MISPNMPEIAVPAGYNIKNETKTGRIFLILKQCGKRLKEGRTGVNPVSSVHWVI